MLPFPTVFTLDQSCEGDVLITFTGLVHSAFLRGGGACGTVRATAASSCGRCASLCAWWLCQWSWSGRPERHPAAPAPSLPPGQGSSAASASAQTHTHTHTHTHAHTLLVWITHEPPVNMDWTEAQDTNKRRLNTETDRWNIVAGWNTRTICEDEMGSASLRSSVLAKRRKRTRWEWKGKSSQRFFRFVFWRRPAAECPIWWCSTPGSIWSLGNHTPPFVFVSRRL